jgi:hypothetical protein
LKYLLEERKKLIRHKQLSKQMDEKEKKQHMKTKVSKELNQHINELVNNKKSRTDVYLLLS